jgi:Arc-like DNA binding dprotein
MARKRAPKGKRIPLNMRTTRELRDRLDAAARASGRSLVQEVEYRIEQSFQTAEAAKAALDDDAIDAYTNSHYTVPLSEIGLWSPEYAQIRQQGGHPPLPLHIVRALCRAAARAKVTPEDYWKDMLQERGIDPDAPYEAPAVAPEPAVG